MNIIDKIAYEYLKKIIIKEEQNPYYENAGNVKKVIDIEHKLTDEGEFCQTYHNFNIFIYNNGYPQINNLYTKFIILEPNTNYYKSQKLNLRRIKWIEYI